MAKGCPPAPRGGGAPRGQRPEDAACHSTAGLRPRLLQIPQESGPRFSSLSADLQNELGVLWRQLPLRIISKGMNPKLKLISVHTWMSRVAPQSHLRVSAVGRLQLRAEAGGGKTSKPQHVWLRGPRLCFLGWRCWCLNGIQVPKWLKISRFDFLGPEAGTFLHL